MPELPEVESVRRALGPIIGARVAAVSVRRRDVIVLPGDPPGGWTRRRARIAEALPLARDRRERANAGELSPALSRESAELSGDALAFPSALLAGATIDALDRRGKQLAIGSTDGREARWLTVQLGMTGQLLLERASDSTLTRSPHDHVEWSLVLRDGHAARLVFRDPRRFGCVRAWDSRATLDEHWGRELGPDALETSDDELAEHLWAVLKRSHRPIKAALLDQSVLAGVGNIYADEALFEACVKPRRRTDRLTREELARLAVALRRVLACAVEAGGSTLRDYVRPDGEPGSYQLRHAVYGRGGEACTRCGTRLKAAIVAQRTSVWCGGCQR